MPTTMHDLARLAGVSVKIVSNVLNGYEKITAKDAGRRHRNVVADFTIKVRGSTAP